HGTGDEGLARLERAFARVVATQPLRERLHTAHTRDVEAARLEGLITDAEANELRAAADAVAAAVAVADFAPAALSPRQVPAGPGPAAVSIAIPARLTPPPLPPRVCAGVGGGGNGDAEVAIFGWGWSHRARHAGSSPPPVCGGGGGGG